MGERCKKYYSEIAYNCQVNYIIIDKLWHYMEKKTPNLYLQLGITANKYSKIRTGECPIEFMKKLWDEQNSPLQRLGLPKEIMLGDSIIEIKGILKEDWEEYLYSRYECGNDNNSKKNEMRKFDNKLRKAFSGLDDSKPKSNIEKLFYFIKHGIAFDDTVNDREMKELQDALNKIKIEHIKACNKKLCKEIESQMQKVLHQISTIIAYNKLK